MVGDAYLTHPGGIDAEDPARPLLESWGPRKGTFAVDLGYVIFRL